jgi:hypothetical protein
MTTRQDFERAWLGTFSRGLREVLGQRSCREIMEGSERLSADSPREEVVRWTRSAMQRLLSLADEDQCKQVMLGCACQYPKTALQKIRARYEETEDLDEAHRMLLESFTSFLRETLQLDDELIADVIERGWGLAGTIEGHSIVATKIPKSGSLAQYMKEHDPEKRQQLYCHCPRIRDVLKTSETIPVAYCYCGGGFYKGIWEEILQAPVEVELLKSVLKGDDVCSFRIRLPR